VSRQAPETPADVHGFEHWILEDHQGAERVAIGAWIVAGLLFVAMAIGPVRRPIDSFDLWFHNLIYPVKWGPLTGLSYVLAFLGSASFVWPLRVVVTAFLWLRHRWMALSAWLLAIVVSEPLVGILKNLYDRPRPPHHLVTEVTPAFPSGHAIAGSVLAISLVIVLVPHGPLRRNLEMTAAGFAFLMAGSRVYLGAHWLTDVCAGVALGAACAIGSAAVVQRWFRYRRGAQESA
jgi:membrane-associated phospholipid phosphatase